MSTPDPTVARRDDLVEQLHGVDVADPYRWMEDLDDPELRDWVDAVADEADEALAALPGRDALRASLRRAMEVPRAGAPWRVGDWWFHRRNSGLQDHDVLWTAPAADDDRAPGTGWRVLLDPNTWEGARSLGPVAASPDGSLLAHAISEAGSDWQTWHVVDVASGELLDDRVLWSKFSGAVWLPGGGGFVTATFEPPPEDELHEAETSGQRVVVHHLGGATEVVHELPDEPQAGFTPWSSHDDDLLVLVVGRGTDPETRLHVAPLTADGLGPVAPLVDEATAAWHPVGVVGNELWCLTDDGAPRRRVVAVPLDGGPHREVLAEGEDQLEEAHLVGASAPGAPGWLLTVHLHHAAARVTVQPLDDAARRSVVPDAGHAVDLGGLVSVGDTIGGEVRTSRRGPVLHLQATGFDHPTRLLRHDAATGDATTLSPTLAPPARTDDVPATEPDVVVERVFVASGHVRVPVFLVRRADVTPTGTVPTVLWGYGGFNIAVTPHFRPGFAAWVAQGGLLAVACLRGGSEYGRAWYDDGRLANKQHVFDDALAVADWLCGEGTAWDDDGAELRGTPWTSSDHLGVEGRSNGGLLAAACLTQRPDRFASAVPEVGVLDLLRFHRFTIGWAWTSDYGDPDDAEAFHVAHAYSPLHRLVEGTAYPATLVTTGDTDDRVVPSHSFKFAAALRHAQGGDAPVLLRVDRAAGHGAGKPTSQVIEERVDVLAWHAWHLGLTPTDEDR